MYLLTVMPSRLSKLFSSSEKEKEALAETERRSGSSSSHSPPPTYEQTQTNHGGNDYDRDNVIDPPDITAGFSNLNIAKAADGLPVTEEVIAHLKLLECFYRLKQTVASHDGLFGIWDEMVTGQGHPDNNKNTECLAKLAEKRWSIYVQRATQRYESWLWMIDPHATAPRRSRLEADGRKGSVVEPAQTLPIGKSKLPPVDVLMVWHAHMLNPRAYLEDCIRQGRMAFWTAGMPWSDVAQAIDSKTFIYNAGAQAQSKWVSSLDSPWENLTDPSRKRVVKCDFCNTDNLIKWTTCTEGHFSKTLVSPDDLPQAIDEMLSSGTGYSDKNLLWFCESCDHMITHESQQAGKLYNDVLMLVKHDKPLAGTVLGEEGVPWRAFGRKAYTLNMPDSPNDLFRKGLDKIILRNPAGRAQSVSDIRESIEIAMNNRVLMRKARGSMSGALQRNERVALRKMMNRYWDNSSPFALDLTGAVIRQGSFIEKMHNIDWLHSPALHNTVGRLIEKYGVFMKILRMYPSKMAVPTLDVDLAWHTHQLSPQNYMKYTVVKCRQFIDHDDKVTETKLNDSFAWTSKTYQSMTGQAYSECTCWYCEAIRESHTSTKSRLFGGNNATIADQLRAEEQDPRKSVHISAHNAVRPDDATLAILSKQKASELERHYQKACERAKKKGKSAPKRDDYYYSDAYGHPVYIPAYSPYVGYVPYMPMYYPVTPGCMAVGVGAAGNCCAGTCGGGAVGGSCGASGGCGGGGSGAGCGGGGGGFGGGGCGGGGGGGGGGCGGGGGGGGC